MLVMVTVIFLVMVIAICSTTISQRNAEAAPTAATGGLRVGISYGNTLLEMTDERLAEALDGVADLGAKWIRIDMAWADVQPNSPQDYVWNQFDRIVSAAHRRGLTVLPVLAYTPGWARRADCSTDKCAPADPARFATFAAAAAARYAHGGVHTWEIWNEENSTNFWQPKPDPVAYTGLLKASSEAIRRADPSAFVVMGGLATLTTAAGNVSPADFVSTASGPNPLRLVDALGVHPYTYPFPASRLGPWASPSDEDDSGLPYLRKILTDSGTPDLPIWITEYGAPTGGPGPQSDGSPNSLLAGPDHVSESQQAAIAADAIATAASEPIIGSLFWYTYRDSASHPDSAESYYGLCRADGSKKPAFAAFKDAGEALTR
jgi:hypothetical protein